MRKTIMPIIFMILLVAMAGALEVKSPEQNATYNESIIPLIVESNETYNEIIYYLDYEEPIRCFNCTGFNETLNLTEGKYTLIVEGLKENETVNESVEFYVNLTKPEEPRNFTLEIAKPENKTYNCSFIPVIVESNETLENITVYVNNYMLDCKNCSYINETLNLSDGKYVLNATGSLDNITRIVSIAFTVNTTIEEKPEEPPKNETEPRFTLGLQHLPQAVERGEINDSELAKIIRENKLNPGIINRLIKTGKLGEESIDAILETQFNPPGILRKVLGFFGLRTSTYATLIHENYNLTEGNLQNLVTREDLPSNAAEQVKQQLQEKTAQRGPQVTPPGLAKKEETKTASGEEKEPQELQRGPPIVVGAQNGDDENWLPPGLAKQGKVPPGLARR